MLLKMKKLFTNSLENIFHLCMKNNPRHMSTRHRITALIYAVIEIFDDSPTRDEQLSRFHGSLFEFRLSNTGSLVGRYRSTITD